MSSDNTRSLRFVSFDSSLVVLTIKRDAHALVFAECLKGSQIKVNRANFFPLIGERNGFQWRFVLGI